MSSHVTRGLHLKPILLLSLLAGCFFPEGEEHITVSSIEVEESEGNFSANLEVEVHLYDFETDALLGCADLKFVDEGRVRYDLDRAFQVAPPARGEWLRVMDIQDRDVYLWVVERDEGECPSTFNSAADDIIGRSLPFPGASLEGTQDMAFERVHHISIGQGARL